MAISIPFGQFQHFSLSDPSKVFAAAVAGIVSHLTIFIRGEWHLYAPQLCFIYILLTTAIIVLQLGSVPENANRTLPIPLSIFFAYLAGLFASMTMYRLLFHRLQKFPGPRLAAVSKLWHVSKLSDGKNHLFLETLRRRYGNIVRTGPNELTIFSAEALWALHGPKSPVLKSAWYDNLYPSVSMVTTRDKAEQDRRRHDWEQGFNVKAQSFYEEKFENDILLLEGHVEKAARNETLMDLTAWFYKLSFDFMGEFTFSQSFGMLESGESHHAIEGFMRAMRVMKWITPTPWLSQIGFRLLPFIPSIQDWNSFTSFCSKLMQERVDCTEKKIDLSQGIIDNTRANGTLLRELNWLYGDAIAMVIAGSDTVAPSLVYLFYETAKRPHEAEKLYEELRHVNPRDYKALKALPILNGFIKESMRLHPVIPSGGLRDTPAEGMTIGNYDIPGCVTIVAPRYSIGRLESCFEEPEEFIPERWFSRPEMIKNKRAYLPFNEGRHQCLGMNMALTELRVVLARLVSKYHIRLAEGDDASRVERDAIDKFTITPGTLKVLFIPRTSLD